MATHELQTPLQEEDVQKLRAGDIVYLSGKIFTLRDQGHKKALETEALEEGFFESNVVYHCGPIVKENNNNHALVSSGPTTSARMDKYTPEFIKKFNIKAIIGKGGISQEAIKGLKEQGVYLAATGGCGALAAKKLEVTGCKWKELGVPEACWKLNSKRFGPLIVAIDSWGNSLYNK